MTSRASAPTDEKEPARHDAQPTSTQRATGGTATLDPIADAEGGAVRAWLALRRERESFGEDAPRADLPPPTQNLGGRR